MTKKLTAKSRSRTSTGKPGPIPPFRKAESGDEAPDSPGKTRRRKSSADPIAHLETLSREEMQELVRELHGSQDRLKKEIAELRQANAELAASHRELDELFDTAPVGCFTLDRQGTILSVNRAGTALLETRRDTLPGKPFSAFLQSADRDKFLHHLSLVLHSPGNAPCDCELELSRNSGAGCSVRLTSAAVRNETGEAVAVRTVLNDITPYKQAEEVLQRNRDVLKSIIDATDVMLVYLDADFNFIWVNPAYAEACHMQPDELVGRNHFKLFPHPENESIFRQVRDTGTPVFFKDKPFIFPDQPDRGVTYWDWSLAPFKDEAGRVAGLVFSLRETTRFKQAELDLAESEERFRLIAETSDDIIFLMDASGRLTYCSPAIKTLGYAEQIIGTHFSEFVLPEEQPQANKALARILTGEKISLFELKVLKADQSTVDLEISATPIIRNGAIVGIQGISRDITRRKYIENALRESKTQLHTTLENLTEGVIVADLDGNLIFWNPAAVSMHGFTSEEEYTRRLTEFTDIFELATTEGKVLPVSQWPLFRILRGESLHNCELKIRRLDHSWQRIYSYGGTLARDNSGQPLLGILTVRDITGRKQKEEKIQLREALLTGINRIFEAGLKCDTDEQLARAALEVATEITGSRCGFIAEIGYNGQPRSLAVCRQNGGVIAGHERMDDGAVLQYFRSGLFSSVLDNGIPQYINGPQTCPGDADPGESRPPLASLLGVPLLHDRRPIGLIALFDRTGGYRDEDLHSIESLARVFKETLFKLRTEKALQLSEARERQHAAEMAQLLNVTPIPIWIAHDPQCQVITSNLAAANLMEARPTANNAQSAGPNQGTGKTRIFKGRIELTPEELPLQQAVRRGTRIEDVELDIVLPNGEVRHLVGEAVPLIDNNGGVQGGIAAFMDITERTWMEEQLRRVKEEWEKTFDSVPDLIAILDNQHRIIRANRAMAERLGLTPGQCVSRKCFSCVHDDACPPENCPHVMTLKDGREHRAEVYEAKLNGYFLVTTTPIYDEYGKMLGSVHVARDITEQKLSEQLLLESERRLKKTQEMAHLGSWELDLFNNVLTWSDEVYRIFGMQAGEFPPCYEDFLALVHPGDRERVQKAYLQSLLDGRKGFDIEHRIVRKSTGAVRYIHEKCEHMRDVNGKVFRSVGMVHDITERKAAEEKIRHLNQELQSSIFELEVVNRELARSNMDLQQFANIISHDLQEPLRTISSFLQLISRRYGGSLDEKAKTFINLAVEGASHMQQQLRDLLAFSRVGGGQLRLQPVSLGTIIDELLLNLKTAIEENQAEIHVDPLPVVLADKTQLNHLLQNLLANALKYRGEEPPRIHIFSRREKNDWVVCVRDNGIGIDPRHADRIFLIFQRLHRRSEYEGTGVGLAICKRIVERHGGRIWVQSEQTGGSLFCFTLPDFQHGMPEAEPGSARPV